MAQELVWDPLPTPEEEEVIELQRYSPGEALEMIAEGRIRDAKSIIGVLLAWRRLCAQECGADTGARDEENLSANP